MEEYRAKYQRVKAGSGNRRGIGETAPIPETRSGRSGRGIGGPRNFIDKLPADLAITGSDKIPAIPDPGKAVIVFVTNNRLVVVVMTFFSNLQTNTGSSVRIGKPTEFITYWQVIFLAFPVVT